LLRRSLAFFAIRHVVLHPLVPAADAAARCVSVSNGINRKTSGGAGGSTLKALAEGVENRRKLQIFTRPEVVALMRACRRAACRDGAVDR
jgi:hypothetical protein